MRNKRRFTILTGALVMLVLVGCGGSSTPAEAPTEVPARAPFEVPTQAPAQAPADQAPADLNSGSANTRSELLIVNHSSIDICFVYISPTSNDEWGPDQLGQVIIAVGQEYGIANIPPGIYDLRLEFCNDAYLQERSIDLTADFTYTVTD